MFCDLGFGFTVEVSGFRGRVYNSVSRVKLGLQTILVRPLDRILGFGDQIK